VTLGMAELGSEESLHKVPRDGGADSPTTHANDIHIVVFDSLHGSEVIVNDRCANAWNLVRTHRGANSAAADRYATLDISGGDRAGQRNDEIGVVVGRIHDMRAEIDYLMSRRAQLGDELLFQAEPAVIRRNTNAHDVISFNVALP
jgi:hypothetical protein